MCVGGLCFDFEGIKMWWWWWQQQQNGLGVTLGTCRGAAARACLNAVYVVLRCR